MRELDPLVGSFSHQKSRAREAEALHILQKIASLVKPIMRARGWKVGTLAEFYPPQQNLLGLNWNHGAKICLRLRYPGDVNQFLPLEQVVDTMLHELSHIVHGPHDAKFNALWDQLRDEYEGLRMKGYTGEGFMSEGKRLGGRSVPMVEARRIARNAAEKRRTLSAGSGQKLGGAPIQAGVDIRQVIVSAIERRNTVLRGCGSGDKNSDQEVKELADQATINGFKTKAEEDKANEDAIAQALWELVQEDEKKKYGTEYIPPTAENPTGNGGGKSEPKTISQKRPAPFSPSKDAERRTSSAPPGQQERKPPRHISRLVPQQPSKTMGAPRKPSTTLSTKPSQSPTVEKKTADTYWECPVCTCHNALSFLCCDACASERPLDITKKLATPQVNMPPPIPTSTKPHTWTCHRCTTIMENKWWTCSTCGTLKQNS